MWVGGRADELPELTARLHRPMMMKMHLVIGSPACWSYSGRRARVCESSMSTSCSLSRCLCDPLIRAICLSVCHSHSPAPSTPPTPRSEAKKEEASPGRGPFILPLSCQTRPARVWSSARDLQRGLQTVWTTVERPSSFCSLALHACMIRDLSRVKKTAQDPGQAKKRERNPPTTPLGSIARAAFLLPFAPIGKHARRTGGSERVGKSMASRRRCLVEPPQGSS